eukprot:scaffold75625_cov19-Tisochrysis_lutea.AAC.2
MQAHAKQPHPLNTLRLWLTDEADASTCRNSAAAEASCKGSPEVAERSGMSQKVVIILRLPRGKPKEKAWLWVATMIMRRLSWLWVATMIMRGLAWLWVATMTMVC